MRGKRKIGAFVMLVIASVLIFSLDVDNKDGDEIYISYIGGRSIEKERSLYEGIRGASRDLNLFVSANFIDEKMPLKSQKEIIEAEIKRGTDGIVVDSIDTLEIDNFFKSKGLKIPIVRINREEYGGVSSNNEKIGIKIGKEIIKNGNFRKDVYILSRDYENEYIENVKKGIKKELSYTKNNIKEFNVDKNVNINVDNNVIIISLDIDLTKRVVEKFKGSEIYALGADDKIISYIEEGLVKGALVKNEFSIGYLGVLNCYKGITRQRVNDKEIDFEMINKENIYDERNQKLIFPFVR